MRELTAVFGGDEKGENIQKTSFGKLNSVVGLERRKRKTGILKPLEGLAID